MTWSKYPSILKPQKSTLVVDVTYLCNAECRYCQWGNDETPGRVSRSLKEILIPAETLTNLKTKRIVISGGEPRRHPDIEHILRYYRNLVDEVVIMTNAYGLTDTEIKKLLNAGATGFTVSLDSMNIMESFLTRSTPSHLYKETLSNLENNFKTSRNFEFGINSVVSHITANWNTVSAMLEFGQKMRVDFIKFQPIFDDGYVSRNSPDLLLSNEDTPYLLDIASKLDTITHPLTNPPDFWIDVAKMASDQPLSAHQCGLGSGQSISVRGNLSMCFWVESSLYGDSSKNMSKNKLLNVQTNFEKEKQKCKVDFHCFCNQSIDHTWQK